MEGIYDGGAHDACFLCALLYPERPTPCPRCDSRMRYRPAVMMDEPALEQAIAGGLQRLAGGDPRAALTAVLDLVYRFQPRSIELLEQYGSSIEELRESWEALP